MCYLIHVGSREENFRKGYKSTQKEKWDSIRLPIVSSILANTGDDQDKNPNSPVPFWGTLQWEYYEAISLDYVYMGT